MSHRHPHDKFAEIAREAVAAYLSAVFEPTDTVEVRLVPSGKSIWCSARELPAQATRLHEANFKGEHVFVGANPRTTYGGKLASDVRFARCLFADFDHASVRHTVTRIDAMQMPVPTLLVSSGHGCHAYWRLAEAIPRLDIWSNWQRDLISLLGTDEKIHDPPRVMRLPGFLNTKETPYVPCEVVECEPSRIYDLPELPIPMRAGSDNVAPMLSVGELKAPAADSLGASTPGARDAVARCRAYLVQCPPAVSGNRGHDVTYHAANTCNRFGLSETQALEVMRWFSAQRCDPPWSEKEIVHKVRDAYHRNASEHGARSSVAPRPASRTRLTASRISLKEFAR